MIDTATNEVIGDPVPLDKYGYFASGDGKYVYVPTLDTSNFDPTQSNDISTVVGSVTVVDVQDPDNPSVVAEVPTGNLPVNVVFSPDKSLAYVVDAGTGTIWVIDTANQEVLDLDPGESGVCGLVSIRRRQPRWASASTSLRPARTEISCLSPTSPTGR